MTRKQIEKAANDYIGFPQEIDGGVGSPASLKQNNMEVKEMTIADVLKTRAFYNNLKVVISDLENTRRKAGMMADAPLKRHPIDRLQERGVFEPGQMTVLYANAMDNFQNLELYFLFLEN